MKDYHVEWARANEPFDMMTCGDCLTMHRTPCGNPKHAIVTKALEKGMGFEHGKYPTDWNQWMKKYFTKFVALRKKFAKFYPKAAK